MALVDGGGIYRDIYDACAVSITSVPICTVRQSCGFAVVQWKICDTLKWQKAESLPGGDHAFSGIAKGNVERELS